jgi:hypothetical protein
VPSAQQFGDLAVRRVKIQFHDIRRPTSHAWGEGRGMGSTMGNIGRLNLAALAHHCTLLGSVTALLEKELSLN